MHNCCNLFLEAKIIIQENCKTHFNLMPTTHTAISKKLCNLVPYKSTSKGLKKSLLRYEKISRYSMYKSCLMRELVSCVVLSHDERKIPRDCVIKFDKFMYWAILGYDCGQTHSKNDDENCWCPKNAKVFIGYRQ